MQRAITSVRRSTIHDSSIVNTGRHFEAGGISSTLLGCTPVQSWSRLCPSHPLQLTLALPNGMKLVLTMPGTEDWRDDDGGVPTFDQDDHGTTCKLPLFTSHLAPTRLTTVGAPVSWNTRPSRWQPSYDDMHNGAQCSFVSRTIPSHMRALRYQYPFGAFACKSRPTGNRARPSMV